MSKNCKDCRESKDFGRILCAMAFCACGIFAIVLESTDPHAWFGPIVVAIPWLLAGLVFMEHDK